MTIKFSETPGAAGGKVADAELHFTEGPLTGMKLVGFAVWQRRSGGLNVTFPARSYAVNGERRSFALLRPVSEPQAAAAIRDFIIAMWETWAARRAAAVQA